MKLSTRDVGLLLLPLLSSWKLTVLGAIGDETFDISVEKALWLMVSVRDRALVGKHDTVGREYICLDPKRFGDFLVHDLWLDLDTNGRILLRVSMEGEKDDIQFYFGRGFRSLKRSEGDMVRIFIDKVRHALWRHVMCRPLIVQRVRCRRSFVSRSRVAF
jgi:hypothetical protein